MDKPNKKPEPAFTLLGRPISGACWQKVVQCCRGDRYQAGLIFYRARAAKAKNIMAWIAAGLQKPEPGKGLPYALTACQDETDNPAAVREFIETEILKYRDTGFQSIGAIMRGMA